MSEAFTKFKEIVGRSQTFAISAGETHDISKFLVAAAINFALKKLGKTAGFENAYAPENFKKFISAILEEDSAGSLDRKENIIIKFDARSLPVKELKYEKEGNIIKIILESNNSGLDTSNIQIAKEIQSVDLLLLIDPKESEIDNILAEIPHKEVIKIGARDRSLALKLTEIIKVLFDKIPNDFREILWFLVKEDEKINPALSKESFVVLQEILDAGVDHEKILRAEEKIFPSSFKKLLGRALTRSHFEKDISTFWSFLPKTDFEKAGEPESSLLNVLQKLRTLNRESKFCALLWSSGESEINALVASPDDAKLRALAALFATAPSSSYFSIDSFESFSEAEIKIRDFIKKVL